MLKSMTGYGRAERTLDGRTVTVELRSVNNRYLDCNVRMPRLYLFAEEGFKAQVQKTISRGKVDVFVSYEDYSEKTSTVRYNKEVAQEYLKFMRQMGEEFGLEDDVRVSMLARFPEVFTMEEAGVDEEELWKELRRAVAGAAVMFVDTRIAEGRHLKEDLLEKLRNMTELVEFISGRMPQIMSEYRRRLEEKVRELLADAAVDESRLLTEVTIFADKVCVDEEIVRLRSHIDTTAKALEEGGSIGRKLDFIAQEMNREANTILSKANDLEISNCAIELKTEIEKVREQIQNIE